MASDEKKGGIHVLSISFLLFILLFSGFVSAADDQTPPVITVPGDMTVEATSSAGATVTFDVNATDDIDGNLDATCTPSSGSTFFLGSTLVNCTATDSSNNTGFNLFTITVVDTTAPVINVPGNIIANATNSTGAVVDYVVNATDNFDESVVVSCDEISGKVFLLEDGTTTVFCDATDSSYNNATTASFTITVVDSAPIITLLGDSVVSLTVGEGYNDAGATADDAVDGNLTANLANINTVNTAATGTYTVIYNVNDSLNNSAQATRTVTVVAPQPQNNGGGGGGGGSKKAANTTCTPNWQCTGWSECADGKQIRSCTDSKNCGKLDERPEILQDCDTGSSEAEIAQAATAVSGTNSKEETIPQETRGPGVLSKITGSVVSNLGKGGAIVLAFVTLLAAAFIISMVVLYRKKRMEWIERDVSKYIGVSHYS